MVKERPGGEKMQDSQVTPHLFLKMENGEIDTFYSVCVIYFH